MKFWYLFFVLTFFSFPAFADIKLSDIHAFETSAGVKNGVLLMSIENTSVKDDKLISATTPVASQVQIHQMSMTGGIMKMRQVGAVSIKAGETSILDPNGYHIMLLGLKKPLVSGVAFPVTLKFERGGEILATVRVRSRGGDIISPDNAMSREMKSMKDMGHMDMKH